ncbi:GlxA family transcriptional regulator [Allosphingosinicella flava]|uniref:GlxA family transcriptional regulator n=1 Tax=Allosphingosinicella flava TaxID=2771430 RepID=A0A7T2LN42_9SPHN|nr:GlxA family transcriptional regulator [Sphingosinicella flava]QPQ55973.1 GlxA family transcriptional regulator [Sphingosinicella flava]
MQQATHRDTHRIVMLAFPDAQILDVTGPLEIFSRTARWTEEHVEAGWTPYSVEIVAERAGSVRMSSGLEIMASRSCFDVDRADTLLVAGGVGHRQVAANAAILSWLKGAAARSDRVGSICTGAFILAAAGLLDGRRATTHWAYCQELSRVANCSVSADTLYVRDGNIYTSAGVTAGMDMALALVEEDMGRAIALRVAQELVMYLFRPGGQSQFSRQLEAQKREGPFGELQLWMIEHLGQPLSLDALAEKAGISSRHFTRRFTAEFGMAPVAYLTHLRIERARSLLETSRQSAKAIARETGFGNEQNLRRAFRKALGVTPEDYRARFGSGSAE